MKQVGSYEAKTHLPALLARVAKGEQITITKHGVPIAILSPARQARSIEINPVIERIKQMRSQLTLGGTSVRELIDGGRRF